MRRYAMCQTNVPGITFGKQSDYENQPQSTIVVQPECHQLAQVGGGCTKAQMAADEVYISKFIYQAKKKIMV